MKLEPGKIAPKSILENIPQLISAYYTKEINFDLSEYQVAFGTSGHRGSSLKGTFNEKHILAITQAVVDYRKENGINGELYIGFDSHALSIPAHNSALQVLSANNIETRYAKDNDFTPTPVISHAILTHPGSDGIVITPSHNPPSDGGFKYNSTNGGPADVDITNWIQNRANKYLKNNLSSVKVDTLEKALDSDCIQEYDFVTPYVEDLSNVIDMEAIKKSGLKIGADAMGGSGMRYYEAIRDMYGLNIEVFHNWADWTFSFMHLDKDGKIRMDCSSPYAMAGLIEMKDKFDIAFGNDTDFDRHGIVTKSKGLLNPNHYLSVAIDYLSKNRDFSNLGIGKTLVSSSMIDRVAKDNNKKLLETPVGFKWFVKPLVDKEIFFGGEESAGASFLRFDKNTWSTDKDGIILNLLSVEILAKEGIDAGEYYEKLVQKHGNPIYARIDAEANKELKEKLKNLTPDDIKADKLAGEEIESVLTTASNGAKIGGLKVNAKNGWFAIRPSGTEDVYKIYAESFIDNNHLKKIQEEAKEIVKSIKDSL
jgi:phosphoglucomutase